MLRRLNDCCVACTFLHSCIKKRLVHDNDSHTDLDCHMAGSELCAVCMFSQIKSRHGPWAALGAGMAVVTSNGIENYVGHRQVTEFNWIELSTWLSQPGLLPQP